MTQSIGSEIIPQLKNFYIKNTAIFNVTVIMNSF